VSPEREARTASLMAKTRKMKKKEEKSWRKVAALSPPRHQGVLHQQRVRLLPKSAEPDVAGAPLCTASSSMPNPRSYRRRGAERRKASGRLHGRPPLRNSPVTTSPGSPPPPTRISRRNPGAAVQFPLHSMQSIGQQALFLAVKEEV